MSVSLPMKWCERCKTFRFCNRGYCYTCNATILSHKSHVAERILCDMIRLGVPRVDAMKTITAMMRG